MLKKITIIALLGLLVSHGLVAQNLPKTMLRLPDTGQTQSFTNIPGEDSDVVQNPPFFLIHGDGTLTDTVTGLMWQQTDGGEMTIEAAETYCQNLTLGGYTDWRLPNVKELESLNDETRSQPSVDLNFFQDIGVKKYWTSTSLPNQSVQAWFMDTRFGVVSHELKTAKNQVRCVRGPSSGTTAVSSVEAVDFRVFPNPFSSSIRVEGSALDGFQVPPVFQLLDGFGRLVFSGQNIAGADFSGLPTGIYFLKIFGKKEATVRLFKI